MRRTPSVLASRWELRVADEPAAWRRAGFFVRRDGTALLGPNVQVKLVGEGDGRGQQRGIVAWGLSSSAGGGTRVLPSDVDGIPIYDTATATAEPPPPPPPSHERVHPNTATSLDHMVLRSDSWERTSAAFEERMGLKYARIRNDIYPGLTQVFYRDGGPIIELIAPSRPSRPSSSSSSSSTNPQQQHPQEGGRARAGGRGGTGGMGDEASGTSSLWGITLTVDDIDAAKAALGDNLSKIRNAKQPGRRIATLNHKAVGVSVNIAFISPHVPGAIPPVGVKSSL